MSIERVVRCWRATGQLSRFNSPARSEDLHALRELLIPEVAKDFLELYAASDGCEPLRGNIQLWAISAAALSILSASDKLRQWSFAVPPQVVVFGGDGCGANLGVWNEPGELAGIIVEIGQPDELACMSIAGTSLVNFLTGRTANYLMACDAPTEAFDLLEVPAALRGTTMDEDGFDRIQRYYDPTLPLSSLDSYNARLDVAGIRDAMRGRPRMISSRVEPR